MNGIGLEVAALITAIGGVIGVILTSRNNAVKIAELQKEIDALKKYRSAARKQIRFFKRLLIKRESENNRLLAREKKWQSWSDEIGRLLNQQQLEIGALQVQLKQRELHNDDTQPLPNIFNTSS